MISTLLVDDEVHNLSTLKLLLEKNCPDLHVVDEATSANDAFAKIRQHNPKLVFLDIKMPRKSGFELLKMFPEINFEVVFVTAFDKYAIRAFEFNALGYILKPINEEKLIHVVGKAVGRIKKNTEDHTMLYFVKSLTDARELVNRFSVHHNGRVVLVDIDEISCVETNGGNTCITMYNNMRYYSSKRLSEFGALLESHHKFITINKSVIVNTAYIKDYTKGELCVINMKTGQAFEVSRRRKVEILRVLTSY